MAGPERPLLSVLMPVFDEAGTVTEAVAAVLRAPLPGPLELVVVDDGSTDGTGEQLRALPPDRRVHVLRHDRNRGKGAAVRTALAHATGRFAAVFDADLEYDPADLAHLVEPLLEGQCRAVFGVRAFDGYTSHSLVYVMGNRCVTWACNVLFNVYLRDIMTCHKVLETSLFRDLGLREDGFTIEPEITARLLRRGERIWELPARYRARGHEDGKKLRARDGLRVLGTLVRCRLRPAR